ncbi:transferase hexapeptide repeat containing protein [Clostridium sp. DL-VIII]|uniref:CatB-related O-acetyltransferase n=1 Tax=Clostridium sp. DL-VIII TaxID=641107 RepID=UPI00023AFC6B|nr:CatB-related O-acetyltransferase [Clostridium sp. DL-VIII]EHJ00170.1 transferase hexapeptide repeat containing protein [Clostridium sp. DL-VIII]
MLIPAENFKRYISLNNGNNENFLIGSIGINSYISDMYFKITPGDKTANLCVGNFTSISNGIGAHFNRNHDYKSVSQHFYSSGNDEVDIFNFKDKKIQQKGHIFIGSDCWIGTNVTLISGIKIGNGALIGANSVVAKDIPPYAIVVGNPAQIIKYRFDEEQIKKLLEIRWWNWGVNKIKENIEWFKKDVAEFTEKFYNSPKSNLEKVEYKHNKTQILFFPDFNEPYSVWRKVLEEYAKVFMEKPDKTLILRIKIDSDYEKNMDMLKNELNKYNKADVVIVDKNIKTEETLFKDADYFIATRNINTSEYIEFANRNNTIILSGTNIPIFTSEFIK